MSLLKIGMDDDLYLDGDLVFDETSGKMLERCNNDWLEVSGIGGSKSKTQQRQDAQAYLNTLGIQVDIDEILTDRYPEYMI